MTHSTFPDLEAAIWLWHGVEVAGEDYPGKRRVWLFAADGEVVRDALYLPARGSRDASFQVVAQLLLCSRHARTLQKEQQIF